MANSQSWVESFPESSSNSSNFSRNLNAKSWQFSIWIDCIFHIELSKGKPLAISLNQAVLTLLRDRYYIRIIKCKFRSSIFSSRKRKPNINRKSLQFGSLRLILHFHSDLVENQVYLHARKSRWKTWSYFSALFSCIVGSFCCKGPDAPIVTSSLEAWK